MRARPLSLALFALSLAACDLAYAPAAAPAHPALPTPTATAAPDAEEDVDAGAEAPAVAEDELPTQLQFVVTHDAVTYVVLRARVEASWGVGPLRLVSRAAPTVVARAVDPARLPRDVASSAARPTVLRRGRDVACVADLGTPLLLRRVEAPWDRVTAWSGEEGGTRASDAQVAAEAWELTEQGELLVAPAIARDGGDCAGAQWAHPEDEVPDVGAATEPVATERVLAAFRATETYRDFQEGWLEVREYLERPQLVAHWDERADAGRRVLAFEAAGGRRHALAFARAEDGCGEFTGGAWALFEETADGLVFVASDYAYEAPVSLIDVDLDGVPEVFFGDTLVGTDGSSVGVVVPFLDCPC